MNAVMANNIKDKVRKLQIKLYLSAKENKKRRYHALYDKIYRFDILQQAWKNVKQNRGCAGIDEQTIQAIEDIGVDKVLKELQEQLIQGRYHPTPVKRAEIPKSNGEKRPLGIPIVKDRIVQAATKLVIEPIFEADFKESSYGFRPKRNAHQALAAIQEGIQDKKYNLVLDADIKSYFNNINHSKLMQLVNMRICDRRVLKLIWKWLKAGVMKDGKYYESDVGSPQGGVISPLLANIYLNYLDRYWEKYGESLGRLVRYCDDFVILCKTSKNVNHAYKLVGHILNKLELKLNLEKTHIVNLWDGKEGFDFLGYHHRKTKVKWEDGSIYYKYQCWFTNKAQKKIRDRVKNILSRSSLYMDLDNIIKYLNRRITGWRNYYGLSRWDKLNRLDNYIIKKLTYWYNIKTKKRKQWKRRNYAKLVKFVEDMGLATLASYNRILKEEGHRKAVCGKTACTV